jgi:CheY-like chemotaxis protein
MRNKNVNRDGHQTSLQKHPRHVPRVLVVDDDVDAVLTIGSIFREFGCEISFALDSQQAQRKMSSGKPDIVVLDWLLDAKTSADWVVAQAVHRLEKFNPPDHLAQIHKCKIITYTSLERPDVALPESPYYIHLDHWKKSLTRPELVRKATSLLSALGL